MVSIRLYRFALFLFSICIAFSGCKKNQVWPEPDLVVKYDAANRNYNATSQYRYSKSEDYQLIPFTSITYVKDNLSDTIRIKYTSTLNDKSGKPSVSITISKSFHRNQLDSLPNGSFITKNSDDFYNVFKAGIVSIVSYDSSGTHKEGIDLALQDSAYFVFQTTANFTPPTPAYLDAENFFEITDSKQEIDFSSLSILGIITGDSYRAILVTVKFKCKLYDTNSPHSSLVLSNGTFQSFFIDR